MLADEIKQRVMQAIKAKSTVEKEILRVALGEIQTIEARTGKMSDEDALAVVRKLVKSNRETLAASESAEQKAQLEEEIRVLETLLPKTLGVEQILLRLEPVREAIKAAGNDGQGTGVAMKHLKSEGASVAGKDVAEAVKQIRS